MYIGSKTSTIPPIFIGIGGCGIIGGCGGTAFADIPCKYPVNLALLIGSISLVREVVPEGAAGGATPFCCGILPKNGFVIGYLKTSFFKKLHYLFTFDNTISNSFNV